MRTLSRVLMSLGGSILLMPVGLLTLVYAGPADEGLAYMGSMLAIGLAPIGIALAAPGCILVAIESVRHRTRPARIDLFLCIIAGLLTLLWPGVLLGWIYPPWQLLAH